MLATSSSARRAAASSFRRASHSKSGSSTAGIRQQLVRDGEKANTSFASGGVKWVAGGWTLFLAENVILSENREWICSRYGENAYHAGYNTLSTAACGSIAYGFYKYRRTGPVWASFNAGAAPRGLRAASMILQSFGLACFVQNLPKLQSPVALDDGTGDAENRLQGARVREQSARAGPQPKPRFTVRARCPMDFKAKEGGGLERISRHANLWALASAGVGTALVTPYAVNALFYSGPLLLAVFGTAHQDSRFRRGMGGTLTPQHERSTSNVPFIALIQGRQDWRALVQEIKWVNAGLASLVVILAHVR